MRVGVIEGVLVGVGVIDGVGLVVGCGETPKLIVGVIDGVIDGITELLGVIDGLICGVFDTDGVGVTLTFKDGVGVGLVGVFSQHSSKFTLKTCSQQPSHTIFTYISIKVAVIPVKSHISPLPIPVQYVTPVIFDDVNPVYTVQFV